MALSSVKPPSSSAEAFELNSHITHGSTLIVFCMDLGTLLEQFKDADLILTYHSPMQRRKAGIVTCIRICTVLEQQFDRECITLIGGPHEGSMSGGITFIDGDRLVKEV